MHAMSFETLSFNDKDAGFRAQHVFGIFARFQRKKSLKLRFYILILLLNSAMLADIFGGSGPRRRFS
jgi:hypothetical protein